MKNYEKYKDKVNNCDSEYFCHDFVKPIILKADGCDSRCARCRLIQAIWLMEEYEEPETDWSKVEVDTPILVRQGKNGKWLERHFAKYENGDVYAWVDGQTSWTGADNIKWKYAKLAESEIDWSKVEVDTPILVRDFENEEWRDRYFARYENETIYVWCDGRTSWSAYDNSDVTNWTYTKLAER